jgi:putative membrane protein
VRVITRPLPALVIFNGALVFTHWPAMVDASVSSELAHFGLHALLVASAFVMWTPVLSPLLELPRLSYPGRMLFLFLQSLVPTVPASFLTFGSHPLYHVYETFPRLGGISALTDQRVAGLVMKILGGFILWGMIAVQFFRWYALERRTEGLDLLDWRDVDRDLNRVRLTKP